MSTTDRDRMLEQLETLLTRFTTELDPLLVLGEQATHLAGTLIQAAGDNLGTDLTVLHRLGWLHWYRYQLLPEGRDQQALATSLSLFEAVHRVDPAAVPPPVRELLEANEALSTNPHDLARAGARLLAQSLSSAGAGPPDTAITLLERAVSATPVKS